MHVCLPYPIGVKSVFLRHVDVDLVVDVDGDGDIFIIGTFSKISPLRIEEVGIVLCLLTLMHAIIVQV
jgi:hypothetical protein